MEGKAKNKIIGASILAIAALGVAAYFLFMKKGSGSTIIINASGEEKQKPLPGQNTRPR